MQPNAFDSLIVGTHGILQNNKLYIKVRNGTYTVPSDWSLILIYQPTDYFSYGQVSLVTWADMFNQSDALKIKTEWQPTGTFYIDPEIVKQEALIKEQAQQKVLDDLQISLQEMKQQLSAKEFEIEKKKQELLAQEKLQEQQLEQSKQNAIAENERLKSQLAASVDITTLISTADVNLPA